MTKYYSSKIMCGLLLGVFSGCGKTSTTSSSSRSSSDASPFDISVNLPRRALLEKEVSAIKRLMTHYRLRYETVVPCASRGFIEVSEYRDEGIAGINVDRSCEILLSMEYGYNLKSDGTGDVYYSSNRMRFLSEDLGGGASLPIRLADPEDDSQGPQIRPGLDGPLSGEGNYSDSAGQGNTYSDSDLENANGLPGSQVNADPSAQSGARVSSAQSGVGNVAQTTTTPLKKRYFRVDFDMKLTDLGRNLGLITEAFRNTEEKSAVDTGAADTTGTRTNGTDIGSSAEDSQRTRPDNTSTNDSEGSDDIVMTTTANKGVNNGGESIQDDDVEVIEDEVDGQLKITYQNDISGFLDDNCTSCHSPTGTFASIDLSTEEGAKDFSSQSNSAIQAGRMPPQQEASSDDKELFKAWIDGGAL